LIQIADEYLDDIIELLHTRVMQKEFSTMQKKNLVVGAVNSQLIAGQLYKLGAKKILRRCVMEHERPMVPAEAHEGITSEHYAGKAIVQKVLHVGYGGQQCIRMEKNIFITVMSVRELVNPTRGMRCP